MTFRSFVALVGLSLSATCMVAPAASAQARDDAASSRATLRVDSSHVAQFASTFDAISALRPEWINQVGVAPNGDALPIVLITVGLQQRPSSLDELRGLPTRDVRIMQFFGPAGSSSRQSGGSTVPVIQVFLK